MADIITAANTAAAFSRGVDTGMNVVGKTIQAYDGTLGRGVSVADIAKIARVEPITLISNSLKTVKELEDIQHGILNIFTGYYMQAISILSTKLVDTRILKILDSVNPDRDMKTMLAATAIGTESYVKEVSREKHAHNVRRYLALEGLDFGIPEGVNVEDVPSIESFTDTVRGVASAMNEGPRTGGVTSSKVDYLEKEEKVVGKVIEVTMHPAKGGAPVTLPIVIRLDNMFLPSDTLKSIITLHEDEITFSSRFRDAMAGRISFIKDFIFCSDLIAKQKKAQINDKSKTFTTLLKRVNNSKLYSALSRNVSLGGISGIIMMSEEEESALKYTFGGGLAVKTVRDIVFNNTSVMMIASVDRNYETVTVYIRDNEGYSTIPFSNFKTAKKTDGDAITEIFKSLSLGNVPSF